MNENTNEIAIPSTEDIINSVFENNDEDTAAEEHYANLAPDFDFMVDESTKTDDEESEDDENIEDNQDFLLALDDFINPINEEDYLDLDDYEFPVLDPELAENPILLKRAQEYENGVKKLVNRLKEKENQFITQDENVNTLLGWNEILSNPETVAVGLQHLVKGLCEQNNLDIYDVLLGIVNDNQENSFDKGYDADIDSLVEKKLKERLRDYEEDLNYIKSTRTQKVEAEKLQNYVDSIYDNVNAKLKKQENGWTLSKEEVAAAVQQFPNIDPIKACKMYHSDSRLEFYQRLSRPNKKAPTIAPANRAEGWTLPKNSSDIKAADIIKMMKG